VRYASTPEYARRLTRLVAQFVDGLITAVPFLVGLALSFFAGEIFVTLGAIGSVLYYLLADGFQHGQSVAKRWFGIAVVDANDGSPCSMIRSCVRNLALAILGPLDWVFILFTARKQRLGDMMAGTVVVTRR
jgi:uncharacterized RDD family membrane protein YckC